MTKIMAMMKLVMLISNAIQQHFLMMIYSGVMEMFQKLFIIPSTD